jgi:negative regulator of sigma E activity
MTQSDEKLSYLLDGYRDDAADAAIDEVIGDVNLQYQARRYRIIGEAMRHELPAAIDTDFHNSVMARIAELEVTEGTPGRAAERTPEKSSLLDWAWFKPLAGLAVAAGVAVITVSLWQPSAGTSESRGETLASDDQRKIEQLAGQPVEGDVVNASSSLRFPGTRWRTEHAMPGLEQKLNAYLVNHTEYSNSVQGLIPQARVAGFDAQQ